MASSATMSMPRNTTHPETVNVPADPAPVFDWISAQQHILRTAPSGDAAIRLLYADLLGDRATLLAENTRLSLELQAALVPPEAPVRLRQRQRPPLRPHILALLKERGTPMSREQIETTLDLGPLNEPLAALVKLRMVTLANAKYALRPEEAAPAVPAPPAKVKRGRTRAEDAA